MKRVSAIAAAAAVVAVSSWAIVSLVYRPYRCIGETTALMNATALMNESRPGQRVMRARENVIQARGIIERCPLNVQPYALLAWNQYVLGQYADAIETLDRSLEVEQRPELYVARADARLALGRFEEAIADYAIAARFDPSMLTGRDDALINRVNERLQTDRAK